MAANHQILRSTVYLTVSRIAGDLAYVAFYVIFSRAFGRSGVGLYAFALELSGVLFIIADYGLSQYLVREISRKRDQLPQYLGTFMALKGISTLTLFGVMGGLAPLFHLDRRPEIMRVFLNRRNDRIAGRRVVQRLIFDRFRKIWRRR